MNANQSNLITINRRTEEEQGIINRANSMILDDYFEFFTVEKLGEFGIIDSNVRQKIINELKKKAQDKNRKNIKKIRENLKKYTSLITNTGYYLDKILIQYKREEAIREDLKHLVELLKEGKNIEETENLKNKLSNDISKILNDFIELHEEIKPFKINPLFSKMSNYSKICEFIACLRMNNKFILEACEKVLKDRAIWVYIMFMDSLIINIINSEKEKAMKKIEKYYKKIFEVLESLATQINNMRDEELKKVVKFYDMGLNTVRDNAEMFDNVADEIKNLKMLRDETILKAYNYEEYKIINNIRKNIDNYIQTDFKDFNYETKILTITEAIKLNKHYLYINKK